MSKPPVRCSAGTSLRRCMNIEGHGGAHAFSSSKDQETQVKAWFAGGELAEKVFPKLGDGPVAQKTVDDFDDAVRLVHYAADDTWSIVVPRGNKATINLPVPREVGKLWTRILPTTEEPEAFGSYLWKHIDATGGNGDVARLLRCALEMLEKKP